LKVLAEKLTKEDGGQKARTLSQKITLAIPTFEATLEVCCLRIPCSKRWQFHTLRQV
jgi:hypothetical protein